MLQGTTSFQQKSGWFNLALIHVFETLLVTENIDN